MSQADTIKEQQIDTALTDIGALYEPPPVEFSFDAVGWTYLLWIVIALLLLSAYFMIRNYRRNKYRRQALAELDRTSISVSGIFVILKRTAIHVFSREKTGQLHGQSWLQFLDETGKGVQFSNYQQEISRALYKDESISPDAMEGLLKNAQKWIRTHAR